MPAVRSPLYAQSVLALGALGMLILAIVFLRTQMRLLATVGSSHAPVLIGVEHEHPLELTLTISAGAGAGIAEVGHRADETMHISIPASWTLREVRGSSLEAITKDPPSFELIRYTLPPHVVLSFTVPAVPEHLTIHNAGASILSVQTVEVHLDTGEVKRDVQLVKDKAELW